MHAGATMLVAVLLIVLHMNRRPAHHRHAFYSKNHLATSAPSACTPIFIPEDHISNPNSLPSHQSSPIHIHPPSHSKCMDMCFSPSNSKSKSKQSKHNANMHAGVATGGSPLSQSMSCHRYLPQRIPTPLSRTGTPGSGQSSGHSMHSGHSAQQPTNNPNPTHSLHVAAMNTHVATKQMHMHGVGLPQQEEELHTSSHSTQHGQHAQHGAHAHLHLQIATEPNIWHNSTTAAKNTRKPIPSDGHYRKFAGYSGVGVHGGPHSLEVQSQRSSASRVLEVSPCGHTESSEASKAIEGSGAVECYGDRSSVEGEGSAGSSSKIPVGERTGGDAKRVREELEGAIRTMRTELSEEQLELFALLGRGAFGYVYHGARLEQSFFCMNIL